MHNTSQDTGQARIRPSVPWYKDSATWWSHITKEAEKLLEEHSFPVLQRSNPGREWLVSLVLKSKQQGCVNLETWDLKLLQTNLRLEKLVHMVKWVFCKKIATSSMFYLARTLFAFPCEGFPPPLSLLTFLVCSRNLLLVTRAGPFIDVTFF